MEASQRSSSLRELTEEELTQLGLISILDLRKEKELLTQERRLIDQERWEIELFIKLIESWLQEVKGHRDARLGILPTWPTWPRDQILANRMQIAL